jgi:hypothetical protein
MAKLTGGGIQSTVNRSVGVRAGKSTTNVVSPRGTSQLGAAQSGKMRQGAHTAVNTSLSVFERKAAEQPLGNAVALNVGKGGPGTGRTTYPSGYQALHGAPVQGSTPKPRDILSEFGPEDPMRRR